jgi:hypothetical protein
MSGTNQLTRSASRALLLGLTWRLRVLPPTDTKPSTEMQCTDRSGSSTAASSNAAADSMQEAIQQQRVATDPMQETDPVSRANARRIPAATQSLMMSGSRLRTSAVKMCPSAPGQSIAHLALTTDRTAPARHNLGRLLRTTTTLISNSQTPQELHSAPGCHVQSAAYNSTLYLRPLCCHVQPTANL